MFGVIPAPLIQHVSVMMLTLPSALPPLEPGIPADVSIFTSPPPPSGLLVTPEYAVCAFKWI